MATTDVTCEKYLEWTSFFWWFYICYGDDDENVEDHHELFDVQIYAKLWIFYAFKICHNKNSHDIVKQKCSFTNREIFFMFSMYTHIKHATSCEFFLKEHKKVVFVVKMWIRRERECEWKLWELRESEKGNFHCHEDMRWYRMSHSARVHGWR